MDEFGLFIELFHRTNLWSAQTPLDAIVAAVLWGPGVSATNGERNRISHGLMCFTSQAAGRCGQSFYFVQFKLEKTSP
jgi:hypothetical protein